MEEWAHAKEMSVLKLIATDLDGTLLADGGQVPPETFELVEALGEEGVRFAVASGRRSGVLHELFAPVADKMDYITANGGEVLAGDKLIESHYFDLERIAALGDFISRHEHLHLTVGNDDATWVYDEPEKFEHFIRSHFWTSYVPGPVPAGTNIPCGVVICLEPDRFEESAQMLIDEMGHLFNFGRTGSGVAIDFTEKHVSKATALDSLCAHYGFAREETLMYGDAMNDCAIMQAAGHAVCVANALPEILAISERVVESSSEHGVQKDMARILENIKAGGDGLIDFGRRDG